MWENTKKAAAIAAVLLVGTLKVQAAIIFDDFNLNEGHFNLQPTFAGQTAATLTTSTADRITTDSLEGAGSEQLVLNHDATATAQRIRFLSGSGTVANNTPFNVTAGTDGFIGFYAKTSSTGWTVSLNLDGAGGTGAEMDGGVAKTLPADGQWHLYEWNLDLPSDWGAVQSIGGGHGASGLVVGTHTIDSIYMFGPTTANATSTILVDFVATNDQGSVAGLVPEPATFATLSLIAAAAAFARRRR